jgi:hypothetical protein
MISAKQGNDNPAKPRVVVISLSRKMEATFSWQEMLPEHKNVIRNEFFDAVTLQMLRFTCKAEHAVISRAHPKSLFERACGRGYLHVCQWIYDTFPAHFFFYDKAVIKEQYHVAQWAFEIGLSVRYTLTRWLIVDDKFEAVKWAHCHGLPMPDEIPTGARDFDMIRWLLKNTEISIARNAWHYVLCHLPQTKDIVLELFERDAFPSYFDLVHAYRSGTWNIFDFIKEYLPGIYANLKAEYGALSMHHEARTVLKKHESINSDTGLIYLEDYSDLPELVPL